MVIGFRPMRTILAAAAAVVALAGPAWAGSPMQGTWRVEAPQYPPYRATALIDSEGRVSLDVATVQNGQPRSTRVLGYVVLAKPRIDLVLTNRNTVTRFVCSVRADEALACRDIDFDGSVSLPLVMTRIGPGPEKLTR